MHGNRSGDLEGVQVTMNPSDLGCAWLPGWPNSDELRPAAMEVEVVFGAHGVFLLPMGIEREDRCMGTGLQTWKGSKAP